MTSDPSKKLLEKITAKEYALLRSLTDKETLDAKWLEAAVGNIVKDRLALARGFMKAARMLAKSKDAIVRRGAVSRAYYGAYHAARATYFAVKRQDEPGHSELSKKIDGLVGEQQGAGNTLTDLRRLREEADYSPYPIPIAQEPYDAAKFESIIKESIRRADELVKLLGKYLKERR